MAPSVGRIVHYTLSDSDVSSIQSARGASSGAHVGNPVAAGDVFAAMVVRMWSDPAEYQPGQSVQLQVFLDGNDAFWATSRSEGEGPGQWAWPPRV